MESTLKDLKERRSIRAYRPEQIKEEELQKILEAGTYAPTGMGMQSPKIIVVQDQETRDYLSKLNARVMGDEGADPFSCWIHRAREVFGSEEGKELLKKWGVEGDYIGVGHCILGYPADGAVPEAKPRKDDYIVYVR